MNPWKLIMDRVVVSRKEDEVFYAVALDEFRSGQVRPGLMAKALAESGGDEQRAKSAYIKLLATAIRDDHYLAQRAQEKLLKESERMVEEKRRSQDREVALTAKGVAGHEEKAKKSSGDSWWVVYVIVAIVFGGWSQLKDDGPASRITQSSKPPVRSAPADSSYDALLTSYERRFPQINPDSPLFNKPLTDQIKAGMNAYRFSGKTLEEALRLAVGDFMEPSKASRSAATTQAPPVNVTSHTGRCEFKAVMTDAGYRACGITPPAVR